MKKNRTGLSERQQEIINASLELIAEHGIQGLTIRNLSKKTGLAESSLYRHYDSKSQILIAILDGIGLPPEPMGQTGNESVFLLLEARFRHHFLAFSQNPVLVSVVFSEELFQNDSFLVDITRRKIEQSIATLTGMIARGQQKGEIRADIQPEMVALMINGSLRMLVKQWKMSGYSFDLMIKGSQLVESLKLILKN